MNRNDIVVQLICLKIILIGRSNISSSSSSKPSAGHSSGTQATFSLIVKLVVNCKCNFTHELLRDYLDLRRVVRNYMQGGYDDDDDYEPFDGK